MSKIRVAVVGAGAIGGAHLRAYAALADACQIVGVADINLAAAQSKAETFGAQPFGDFEEMFDVCRPDAISICTPPNLHLPIATAAAERGIASLCEKPPARTVAETEALVAAFARANVPLQFAFCHRFHTPVKQAQALIAGGRLGRIIQIYNRFGFRFERATSSWFTDPAVAGGGVLIDTLVHSIDIFRALAGEVVGVSAAVSTTLPVTVEDSASLQVVSQQGAIGSLICSWVTPVSEAEIRIWGTEGEAIIDYTQPGGLRYKLASDTSWTDLPFEEPDRFVQQAAAFLTSVREGTPPLIGGADGIAVMRVIENAYQAARSNGAAIAL